MIIIWSLLAHMCSRIFCINRHYARAKRSCEYWICIQNFYSTTNSSGIF